jgi:hypothetical protein
MEPDGPSLHPPEACWWPEVAILEVGYRQALPPLVLESDGAKVFERAAG